MTTDKQERKNRPIARGVLDYFPDAIAEIAHVSFVANEQHNPGQPMHWAKGKSTDHADSLVRHLLERGTVDTDGLRHTAKVAWRALALLQTELEGGAGDVEEVVERKWQEIEGHTTPLYIFTNIGQVHKPKSAWVRVDPHKRGAFARFFEHGEAEVVVLRESNCASPETDASFVYIHRPEWMTDDVVERIMGVFETIEAETEGDGDDCE